MKSTRITASISSVVSRGTQGCLQDRRIVDQAVNLSERRTRIFGDVLGCGEVPEVGDPQLGRRSVRVTLGEDGFESFFATGDDAHGGTAQPRASVRKRSTDSRRCAGDQGSSSPLDLHRGGTVPPFFFVACSCPASGRQSHTERLQLGIGVLP